MQNGVRARVQDSGGRQMRDEVRGQMRDQVRDQMRGPVRVCLHSPGEEQTEFTRRFSNISTHFGKPVRGSKCSYYIGYIPFLYNKV